ncbi:PDZ domain-containing protein [Sphingobacterium spiritivorum]|uniref:PDZ domain-containing protein n=1 Tax=Sphingobacterium spiritivorum TaxID=258 RepID=UPI001918E731|nr:PDZ domain-containing protein [Sphingobacterium spiritivorum]QQT25526.1 peptide-binding protein [Sphingobacterium spiritivorum]
MNYALTFMPRLLALYIVCAVGGAVTANAQSTPVKKIYVAKSGRDNNPGTATRPYATPNTALQAVSKLKKSGYKGTVDVIINEGTYYLDRSLDLSHEESGTKSAPLTIQSAKGQQVVLSGAVPLHLQWKKGEKGIWTAQVPNGLRFQSLYADGKALVRARYPNYDPTILPFQGYAADAISPERVSKWKNPEGAIVHALHIGRWGGFHYRVTGKDMDGKLQMEGGLQNNRPSKMHDTYRYVENVFEELDAPNEWYLEEKTSTLYYYAANGKNPQQQKLEAPVLENIISISGSKAKPVHDIHVKGIHFVHTTPTFMKTDEPLLRSDWTIYRQGAVRIANAERCQISGSDFYDLGGNAVFVSNYNRDVVISDNLIERIGASAISFVGNPDAVRSPAFRYEKFVPEADMDTIKGPKSDDYPLNCEASNNLIRHIGLIEKQVAGVQISMASAIRVLHNTIYDVPRAGINVGDGTWGGHDIAHNDVFRTVLETSDHGAFNSWGRDRFWHPDREEMNSLATAHPDWVTLDAVAPTLIRNNRFQCDHGWDIDLDDGSTNYQIYNNLCLSGGLKLREGFYRTVYNNVILNNGFHPHVWFKNSHDVFRNNILMQSHQDIQVRYWGDTVDYNYYTNIDDLKKDQAKGVEQNSILLDGTFADAPKGDFRIKGNIPAGFKNFNMLDVGVTSSRLLVKAAKPEIPALAKQKGNQGSQIVRWGGGEFKSIETLGEQSAAGLPAIAGVLVVNLSENSTLYKSGLRIGDVIVICQKTATDSVDDFIRIAKRDAYTGQLAVTVFRNQVKQDFIVKL